MIALLNRLHIQLALIVVALLVVVFAGLSWLLRVQAVSAVLETSQRQNLQLAYSVATMQPRDLIDSNGRVDEPLMRSLAINVMKINPTIEVYLLDGKGKVVAHALDNRTLSSSVVDLDPVRKLALPSINSPRFPVLGTDPLRPNQAGVFSAVALGRGNTPDGYLYVMLGGANNSVQSTSPAPDTLRQVGLGMFGLLLVTAGIIAWVLRYLTRPLRQLTQNVLSFDGSDKSDKMCPAASEIQVLDNAIRSMQAEIHRQITAIKEQDKMRRELIGNVSHDLRTPLATLQGYIETIRIDCDATSNLMTINERRQYLDTALNQAKRLARRVNELFELSQLDSANVTVQFSSFCLAELVQDVLAAYQLRATTREITLAFSPGPAPEAMVYADISLIERVLQNLLDNAIKFVNTGGRIQVEISPVNPAFVCDGLRVEVANTGDSIPFQDIPHLFERYWRGANKSSLPHVYGNGPIVGASERPEKIAGNSAGLGLAIVKRILDLHDTTILASSIPGGLTIFSFTLKHSK
ncbi:MAG: HAMP domain-containing sensor histidine kinase [Burkholderiaceae bacterium]